jgi:UDP-GlcNAc:undecaprenyl-phosphate/decaprenyl-phosphate GlcNAc-1-phosphate transferase
MLLDLAIVVAIAIVVSLVVCRAIIAAGPIDAPTEDRKIHKSPTPTSGGLGIGAGFIVAMVALSLFSQVWRYEVHPQGVAMLWTSTLFALPLLIIGFIDDTRHLSARLKFVLYGALSLGAAWSMGVVQELHFGPHVLTLPPLIGLIGAALWVFTVINVVNFMDGANGLAMGSVAIGLLILAMTALDAGIYSAAALSLCGAGALAGFLFWNIPGGRLFAGDSGALFAGSLAAFACLILIERTGASAFVAPLFFFPLLADGLLTLLYRARRGRSLFVGHREHLYQVAMAAGWGHIRVSLLYWALSAFCAAIAGVALRDPTRWAPIIALASLALVALVVDAIVRRWAEPKGLLQR